MIVDVDVHPALHGSDALQPYLPGAWKERFSRYGLGGGSGMKIRYPADISSPQYILDASDPAVIATKHLDAWDIEAAVLVPLDAARVCAMPDPVDAGVLATAVNDSLIDSWLPVDERFHLAAAVTSHDPAHAAAQIRHYAENPRVVATFLVTTGDRRLGYPEFRPIFAAAEECQLPIILHPNADEGIYFGGPAVALGPPRFLPELRCCRADVAAAQLASLIFAGTFEEFQGVKLVFNEFNFTWLQPLLWRIEAEWRFFRADVPWVRELPSTYVKRNVRFGTQPMEEPQDVRHLHAILEMMDAGTTLMYCSDVPHFDFDSPDVVRRVMPASIRERVMRENAIDTFGHRMFAGRTKTAISPPESAPTSAAT